MEGETVKELIYQKETNELAKNLCLKYKIRKYLNLSVPDNIQGKDGKILISKIIEGIDIDMVLDKLEIISGADTKINEKQCIGIIKYLTDINRIADKSFGEDEAKELGCIYEDGTYGRELVIMIYDYLKIREMLGMTNPQYLQSSTSEEGIILIPKLLEIVLDQNHSASSDLMKILQKIYAVKFESESLKI